MIDQFLRWLIGPIAARWYRWDVTRSRSRIAWVREWHLNHPGKCMYCEYTNWVNREKGQRLKINPHACIEDNGGPKDGIPAARVVTRTTKDEP